MPISSALHRQLLRLGYTKRTKKPRKTPRTDEVSATVRDLVTMYDPPPTEHKHPKVKLVDRSGVDHLALSLSDEPGDEPIPWLDGMVFELSGQDEKWVLEWEGRRWARIGSHMLVHLAVDPGDDSDDPDVYVLNYAHAQTGVIRSPGPAVVPLGSLSSVMARFDAVADTPYEKVDPNAIPHMDYDRGIDSIVEYGGMVIDAFVAKHPDTPIMVIGVHVDEDFISWSMETSENFAANSDDVDEHRPNPDKAWEMGYWKFELVSDLVEEGEPEIGWGDSYEHYRKHVAPLYDRARDVDDYTPEGRHLRWVKDVYRQEAGRRKRAAVGAALRQLVESGRADAIVWDDPAYLIVQEHDTGEVHATGERIDGAWAWLNPPRAIKTSSWITPE